MTHERKHDNSLLGWFIGAYRLAVITATVCLSAVFWYYWDDMKNAIEKVADNFQVLAINVAGINQQLASLDKAAVRLEDVTSKLQENQNSIKDNQRDILIIVNRHSDELARLKMEVDYLKK